MKYRGFTFIEVILSVIIISIISIGFMTALRANYMMLAAGKHKTDEVFANKSSIDGEIEQARLALSDGSLSANKRIDRPFNMLPSIELYQLQRTTAGKQLVTWVGPDKQRGFLRAGLQRVSLELKGWPLSRSFYYAKNGIYLKADYDVKGGTEGVFDRVQYDWYISRPNFNIAVRDRDHITENEWGTRYPQFPNDYSVLNGNGGRRLDITPDFAGRHVVLNVTPIDKNGIAGEAMQSEPFYFCGLPSTRYLAAHFDAALVNLQEPQSSVGEVYNDRLNAWYDAAHGRYIGIAEDVRPYIYKQPIDGDFVGQYMQFDASKQIVIDNRSLVDFANFTVFMVINSVNGTPVFDDNTSVSSLTTIPINGDWRIAVCELQCSRPFIEVGYGDFKAAELVFYNKLLSRSERIALLEHLATKYRPIEPRDKVERLINISETTEVGALYTMPVTASAVMPDGSTRRVPVIWDDAITNDQIGAYSARGHLLGDEDKQLTYHLIVEENATQD